jgi:ketosteroid isomerase-like protein
VSEQNRKVALDFVAAMGANDLEAAAACMAPDGVLVAKGTGKFAGVHSPEMIAGSIEAMRKMLPKGLGFAIVSVTAEGDRVVVEAQSNADVGEGEPFRNDYVFVISFEEGRIKRCNEYYCTNLADRVLWPIAERAGYGFDG